MEHRSLATAGFHSFGSGRENERRFCALLIRRWGRLGTSGRVRFEAHHDMSATLAALATVEYTRRRRGYWRSNKKWHGFDAGGAACSQRQ